MANNRHMSAPSSSPPPSHRDHACAGGCNHDHSVEQALFDIPLDERMVQMRGLRDQGNAAFAVKNDEEASRCYGRALLLASYAFPEDPDAVIALDSLRTACLCNCAAVELRCEKYVQAIAHATEALGIDSKNVKALFRRAVARRHQQLYAESARDLAAALALAPDDLRIKEEMRALAHDRADAKRELARMSRAMMRGQ